MYRANIQSCIAPGFRGEQRCDDWHEHVFDQRFNQAGARSPHDKPDGQANHFVFLQKCQEFFEHLTVSIARSF
jgi:hypothetical protein